MVQLISQLDISSSSDNYFWHHFFKVSFVELLLLRKRELYFTNFFHGWKINSLNHVLPFLSFWLFLSVCLLVYSVDFFSVCLSYTLSFFYSLFVSLILFLSFILSLSLFSSIFSSIFISSFLSFFLCIFFYVKWKEIFLACSSRRKMPHQVFVRIDPSIFTQHRIGLVMY